MGWTNPTTRSTDDLITAAIWNTDVVENLKSIPHLIARKTSDQSVTSSTAMVDDDALLLTAGANEVWFVEFGILQSGSSSGDIRIGFSFPSGASIAFSTTGDNAAAATFFWPFWATTSPHDGAVFNCLSSTNRTFLSIKGVFTNGGTAGNLRLRWSQGTSNATATVVHANSTLWATKLA